MVLVLELDARLAQELVHLQLLGLGQGLGVVAVEGTHVSEQRSCAGKAMTLLAAAFDVADDVVAVTAVVALATVRAFVLDLSLAISTSQTGRSAFRALVLANAVLTQTFAIALCAEIPVIGFAVRTEAVTALAAVVLLPIVLAKAAAAAVAADMPLPSVWALLVNLACRHGGCFGRLRRSLARSRACPFPAGGRLNALVQHANPAAREGDYLHAD